MEKEKPEESEQDFPRLRETLTSEFDKLPESLEQNHQLLKKTSILREQYNVSNNVSADSYVPAESVRACMEIICNISELLELQKSGEGINPDELKILKDRLENESTKINMVSDYLNEVYVPDTSLHQRPELDFSFSPDNSFDSVSYFGK
ncbi:uncharacterized protein LOC129802121 [Phlebotomus papatasi]|uniref:uncharacterized protein LOC129802121 n=1 Tax=Phlebotomus papatasi TaxID=29031 RepID=UPI002483FB7B|nr:uncharacterized protein LOC129802121 [Phlebotomus papatasi]